MRDGLRIMSLWEVGKGFRVGSVEEDRFRKKVCLFKVRNG